MPRKISAYRSYFLFASLIALLSAGAGKFWPRRPP